MSKHFRPWNIDQTLLLPPSVQDFVAKDLYSSRRIARACCERNDFVMIVALDPPDFRTISDYLSVICRIIVRHALLGY